MRLGPIKKSLKLVRKRLSLRVFVRRCVACVYLGWTLMAGVEDDRECWGGTEGRGSVATIDIRHEINVAHQHAVPSV